MFVHFTPGTWNRSESDTPALPLNRFDPAKLNTDQWCEVALSWGAKEVLFVAKHVGGFCWWQTGSDYSIGNTPYKGGKGDVLSELAQSCRKYGLNLGVYIYPGDMQWGAGPGSGGQTADPSRQAAYNKVFREQLTEVLSEYGDVLEVWFDGSCKIEIGDILDKYAKNSVVFQGPHATIRWPGTESGKLAYPAWNSVRCKDLRTGVSTQLHGTPDGDCWAPLEADTPLYEHYWLWSPENIKKRKSIEMLMECYYKSAGYGGVFLLNATPDTTGLIPDSDVEHYKALGAEIDRRFKTPLKSIENAQGTISRITFSSPTLINHVVTMEDYRKGERIRAYRIKGLVDGEWIELVEGQSVGRKKIDYFDEAEVSAVELNITEHVGSPLIRSISVYYVDQFTPFKNESLNIWAATAEVMEFKENMFVSGKAEIEVDLSDLINLPGQYVVKVIPADPGAKIKLTDAEVYYDGAQALQEFVIITGLSLHINRTAIVADRGSSVLTFTIESESPCKGRITFNPALVY
jgi:alpha-L-fucosidase